MVRGFSPVLREQITIGGKDVVLPATALQPAGLLLARVKDARTGKPPPTWKAVLTQTKNVSQGLADFFASWPIAQGGEVLDFGSVPPGAWDLVIEAPDHRVGRRKELTFRPGETTSIGDLFLVGGGALEVHLTFPSELPPGQLALSVWAEGRMGPKDVPLGQRFVWPTRGVFAEFGDLDAGVVFLLVATIPPSALWRRIEVPIAADQVAEVSEEFAPIRIHGEVWKGSEPVANASVGLTQSGGKGFPTNSNEKGEYEIFAWAPGFYGVRVTAPGLVRVEEKIEVPADVPDFIHDISLPNASIEGVVLDDQRGSPVDKADVLIQSASTEEGMKDHPGQAASARSKQDGTFQFEGLRTEPFDLEVRAPTYALKVVRNSLPTEEGARIEIRLSRGHRVEGVVRDLQGRPVPMARVGFDVDLTGLDFADERMTSETGAFEFDDVTEGQHAICIHKCGYALALALLDADDTDEPTTIALPPAGRPVHISFVDQEGNGRSLPGVSFMINGVRVPNGAVARHLIECVGGGSSQGYDVDFLPPSTIQMMAPGGRVVGSFSNLGTTDRWTVRVPTEQPPPP
jgi:hypothetical protein